MENEDDEFKAKAAKLALKLADVVEQEQRSVAAAALVMTLCALSKVSNVGLDLTLAAVKDFWDSAESTSSTIQ